MTTLVRCGKIETMEEEVMTTTGVLEVVMPNGDIVRVYDVKVEFEIMTDPEKGFWSIMGKTSRDADKWMYIGGYFDKNEYKLFSQMKLLREHFEYSAILKKPVRHHMIEW